MPFGAHETMEVHEVLNEKINFINHFELYASQCRNGQLRQMIDRHLQTAVQDYNQLVAYTHDYNASNGQMQSQQSQQWQQSQNNQNAQSQQIQYGLHNPPAQTPQFQGAFNDQQIMLAMLNCHKNSAKNSMISAIECADANIRQILIHSAVTCAEQAYETFLFMNQQGQYQVPTMKDQTAKTYLHSYQPTQGYQQQ